MHRVIVMTAVGLLTGMPALAWHETGHKATAAIAFDRLSAARQREVISILRAHPRFDEDFRSLMPEEFSNATDDERGTWLFEQASIWPDLVQTLEDDVRRDYNRSRWHYINLLVWLTDDDQPALQDKLDHNVSTEFSPPLRQNLNIVQALRGNLELWRDANAPDAEKAIALCWILHLAGDLHQPLHTVALFSEAYFPTGDRGGNSINVDWGDETRNLHAVWDGLPTDMESLEPSARTLLSIQSDEVDAQAIDDWLYHHAQLARRFVYTDDVKQQLLTGLDNDELPTIKLSHEYLVAARAIARRQVNLAGHRIAALL